MSILIPNGMNPYNLCSLVCVSYSHPRASYLSVSSTILLFPLSFFQTLLWNHNYWFNLIGGINGSPIDLNVVTLMLIKTFIISKQSQCCLKLLYVLSY